MATTIPDRIDLSAFVPIFNDKNQPPLLTVNQQKLTLNTHALRLLDKPERVAVLLNDRDGMFLIQKRDDNQPDGYKVAVNGKFMVTALIRVLLRDDTRSRQIRLTVTEHGLLGSYSESES